MHGGTENARLENDEPIHRSEKRQTKLSVMEQSNSITAYRAVFEKLRELVPDFAPFTAMVDFKKATVSALHGVCGDNVRILGAAYTMANCLCSQ